MPVPASLEVCELTVLAERLRLDEDALAGRRPGSFLTHSLLRHYPHLGERSAEEVVDQTLRRWGTPLDGLRELARRLLVVRQGQLRLAADAELREVRRLLDEELLLAARLAEQSAASGTRLEVDPDLLVSYVPQPDLPADVAAILNRQVAETHVHLWGAVPPTYVWLPAMLGLVRVRDLARVAAIAEVRERGSLDPPPGLETWAVRLLDAVLLRWWLAGALCRPSAGDVHPFRHIRGLQEELAMTEEAGGFLRAEGRPEVVSVLVRRCRELFARIGYAQRKGADGPALPGCPIWRDPGGEFPYRDPLSQAVELDLGLRRPTDCLACGERYLLASCLLALRGREEGWLHPTRGEEIEERFLAYVRVKGAFFRLLFHQRGGRGLDRFVRQFDRRRPLASSFSSPGRRARWDPGRPVQNRSAEVWHLSLLRFQTRLAVLHWLRSSTRLPLVAPSAGRDGTATNTILQLLEAQRRRLARKLELRVSPCAGPLLLRELWAYLRGLRDALAVVEAAQPAVTRVSSADTPLPVSSIHFQAGFIYHLKKGERNGKPIPPSHHFEMTGKLLGLLRHRPELRPILLGLDAAGRELAAPPAVFAPAFRRVLRDLSRLHPSGSVLPHVFGRTFHVGEDFRDLLTGLRQVDLAVVLLDLSPGDRLGHAVALGVDPEPWYQDHPTTFPRLGEHLMDLAWASHLLALEDGERPHRASVAIRRRLRRLGIRNVEAPQDRFEAWLPARGQELAPDAAAADEGRLHQDLIELLSDGDGRSSDPRTQFDLRADRVWMETIRTLQDIAIRRVERAGVVIEANPTSNVLIAELRDFGHHPIFRLRPIDTPPGGDVPALRVSVSTDDPGMFQVSLAEEYAALFEAALKREGMTRSQAIAWLDRVRGESYDSSFMEGPAADLYRFRRYLEALLQERSREAAT